MSLISHQKILKLSHLAFFTLTQVISPPSLTQSLWAEEGNPLLAQPEFFIPSMCDVELTSLEASEAQNVGSIKEKPRFHQLKIGQYTLSTQNSRCPPENSSVTFCLILTSFYKIFHSYPVLEFFQRQESSQKRHTLQLWDSSKCYTVLHHVNLKYMTCNSAFMTA